MNQIWPTAYFCKYVLIGRVMSICLSIAHGHFGTTVAEFSCCNRDPRACNVKNIYSQILYKQCLICWPTVQYTNLQRNDKRYAKPSVQKAVVQWEIACLSMQIVSDTPWTVVVVGFLCMSFYYCGVPLVGLWWVMLLVSKTSLSLPFWHIWLWGFGQWKVSECDTIRGFTFTFVVWLNSWAYAICQ